MTVEAIKAAITALPEQERQSLKFWLNNFDYDDWDRQMVTDFSPGGRGMWLVEKMKQEAAAADTKDFFEGLAQAKDLLESSKP